MRSVQCILYLLDVPRTDPAVDVLLDFQPAGQPAALLAALPKTVAADAAGLLGFWFHLHTGVGDVGLRGRNQVPDLATGDLATPTLLASEIIPPAAGVIVMVGIMAAAVSTIDSIMLTLSSMVARDVVGGIKPGISERRQLAIGKFVLPVIALLAYAFAQLELDLIAVLSVSASAGLLVLVPPTIGTFFWRRGTA